MIKLGLEICALVSSAHHQLQLSLILPITPVDQGQTFSIYYSDEQGSLLPVLYHYTHNEAPPLVLYIYALLP